MAIPLLAETPLAWIVPIGDSVILLVLCALVTIHPVYSFRQGLAELAGVSADPAALKSGTDTAGKPAARKKTNVKTPTKAKAKTKVKAKTKTKTRPRSGSST